VLSEPILRTGLRKYVAAFANRSTKAPVLAQMKRNLPQGEVCGGDLRSGGEEGWENGLQIDEIVVYNKIFA